MSTSEAVSTQRLYDGQWKYDNTVAATYDASRELEFHWIREDKFVAEYVRDKVPHSLLDLPVGTGRFLPHYADVGDVTGVDVSEEMLKQARTKSATLAARSVIQLEKGDLFNLPYPDRRFQTAVVFRLFHLIPPHLVDTAVESLCRVVEQDIVLQAYASGPSGKLSWSRIKVRLSKTAWRLWNRTAKPRYGVHPQQPWRHIEAFFHSQHALDAAFASQGFVPMQRQLLDRYGRRDVTATVYTRQGD